MVNGHYRHSVVVPGVDHPVHQFPFFGEGVELQDFNKVGIVITA